MGGAVALVLVAAGCSFPQPPVVTEDRGPARLGPNLVVNVVNERDEEAHLLVEFESPNASGGTEGPIDACMSLAFVAEVVGQYRLLVDGDEVLAGVVPREAGPDDHGVIQLVLPAAGAVRAMGPAWRRAEPIVAPRALPGCG